MIEGNPIHLQKLVNRYCDGTLSLEEVARLRTLLREDSAARLEFLERVDLHARLCWEFGAGCSSEKEVAREPCTACAGTRGPTGRPQVRALSWSCAVMVAAFLAVAIFWWRADAPHDLSNEDPPPAVVAIYERGLNVHWGGDTHYEVGDAIPACSLELLHGLAVLRTTSGATVTIEAPAQLELTAASTAFLRSGRIAVLADASDGYVVETDRIQVVDTGTEFGVSVEPAGEEVVQVFSGRVLADFRKGGCNEQGIELTAGEACGLAGSDAAPERIPFASERFVRTLPGPHGDEDDFRAAFQTRSQIETIDVAPAPSKVVLDGDLSDWNLAGKFIGRFDPPYDEAYNATGAMMYDEDRLYIAAHVRDPAPMRSVIPPDADHSYCYRGGSVQVRLCSDPSLPWPLAEYGHGGASAAGAQPPRPPLVHLTMWYYTASDEPCLQISYGVPPLQTRSPKSKGWSGAYQMDPDERGYTLEYAIPWRLLQDDARRFRPGEETAVCWQVNWADRTGRIRIAQLNECVHLASIQHPRDLIDCWRRTASWGRARFLPETGSDAAGGQGITR